MTDTIDKKSKDMPIFKVKGPVVVQDADAETEFEDFGTYRKSGLALSASVITLSSGALYALKQQK